MPPRNRILLEQHQRIIQAFEDVNEDYLMVAATIGVNNSKKYHCTILVRRKDHRETTRRNKSCLSRWWNKELPGWHFEQNLPANTSTDKSRIETGCSKKTNNPWLYSNQNTWRYIVSWEIGKANPSWTKPPLCPAKKTWLCQLVHVLCCSES